MNKNPIVPDSLLPLPRLEIRWLEPEAIEGDVRKRYVVKYLLIWAVCGYDCRVEQGKNFIEVELGETVVTSPTGPSIPHNASTWKDVERIDTPIRDGVHIKMDSFALGGIPAYVTYNAHGHKIDC